MYRVMIMYPNQEGATFTKTKRGVTLLYLCNTSWSNSYG